MIKTAFQMDSLDTLKFASDSTWQLMIEGSKRGIIYHFTPKDLIWLNDRVMAYLSQVHINNDLTFKLDNANLIDLTEMDILFIRQDPPYDMKYLTGTYLLEKISKQVLMINNPTAIRNFPEKLSVLDYPSLTPKTLITYNHLNAKAFASSFDKVIIKPLYGFAGSDVFCLKHDDLNFINIIDNLIQIHKTPVIIQEFIPEVSQGDKRIILVDGEPVGAFLRIPKTGDIRANLACGGTAIFCDITDSDLNICKLIKPKLVENGLFFVGIDVIAGYLTEINTTSPTGLVPIQQYSNPNITSNIWDKILNKLALL
jgi:glutathione synthase